MCPRTAGTLRIARAPSSVSAGTIWVRGGASSHAMAPSTNQP
jgi:hypothetical protein